MNGFWPVFEIFQRTSFCLGWIILPAYPAREFAPSFLHSSLHINNPLARGISPIKDNSRLRMPTALAFPFVPRLSRLPSCDRPIILSAVTFIQGRARTPGRADHERELDARVSACLYPRIRRKQDIGERIEVKRWPPRLFL